MDPLFIIGSNECPTIILDKDKASFEITGQSLPEEAISFYSPVIDWFEDYIKDPLPETVLVLKLDYCNSSSTKAIADVLEVLEELYKKGSKVEVRWMYMEDDDDMLDVGKEFQEIIKIPFAFVSLKPD
jgi:SiaC family regulatory phosphoprotein